MSLAEKITVVDTLKTHAPLGIRFWDKVFDKPVTQGLSVAAYALSKPANWVWAQRNASGIYVFHQLPGWSNLQDVPYVITVSDTSGQYLPMAFTVNKLPKDGLLLHEPVGSPADALKGIFLFSTPARKVPGWLAAIRGRLLDEPANQPAANALVGVTIQEGSVFYGLTDAKGEFLIVMPYPTTPEPLLASPSGPGGIEIHDQHWGISLEVRYLPASLHIYPETHLPDLLDLLMQPLANVRLSVAGALASSMEAELGFNRQLVLHTDGDDEGRLLVSPIGFP